MIVVVVAALWLAATTQAQQVTHIGGPISGSNIAPAGTLCDVAVKTSFTGTVRLTVFGDPNNPTRVIEHDTFSVVHTNLATGQYATEFNVGTAHSVGDTTMLTSLFMWHVRTEAGKLVLNGAGMLTFNENGVSTETPGLHNDPGLLCPIIGANPASELRGAGTSIGVARARFALGRRVALRCDGWVPTRRRGSAPEARLDLDVERAA
jgi:hypothetical protein